MAEHKSFGPTVRETEILDLAETGLSSAAIGERLGLAERYVRDVRSRLSVSAREPWKEDARRGSAMLLEAIHRHHPEMIIGRAA